ncbi:MAG TPA: SprB repeat-containing protein, partial [Saprospiraceae bacterium]|nr:SprB repeat-containing protein [Saprospiraceae bacterium]
MHNTCTNSLIRLVASALFILLTSQLLTAQISVSIVATPVSCYGGNDGSASANVSGGASPYSFSWSNGQTTALVTDLAAGVYTLIVTDAAGQSVTTVANINQPSALQVTAFGASQICDIVPDGSATAVPFGGTPPYSYLWSNGTASAQNNGLYAGT